jgi:hypothetical protein
MLASSMRFSRGVNLYRSEGGKRKRCEKLTRAKAINLVRVYFSVCRIIHYPVRRNGGLDASGEGLHLVCKILLATDGGHDLEAEER